MRRSSVTFPGRNYEVGLLPVTDAVRPSADVGTSSSSWPRGRGCCGGGASTSTLCTMPQATPALRCDYMHRCYMHHILITGGVILGTATHALCGTCPHDDQVPLSLFPTHLLPNRQGARAPYSPAPGSCSHSIHTYSHTGGVPVHRVRQPLGL